MLLESTLHWMQHIGKHRVHRIPGSLHACSSGRLGDRQELSELISPADTSRQLHVLKDPDCCRLQDVSSYRSCGHLLVAGPEISPASRIHDLQPTAFFEPAELSSLADGFEPAGDCVTPPRLGLVQGDMEDLRSSISGKPLCFHFRLGSPKLTMGKGSCMSASSDQLIRRARWIFVDGHPCPARMAVQGLRVCMPPGKPSSALEALQRRELRTKIESGTTVESGSDTSARGDFCRMKSASKALAWDSDFDTLSKMSASVRS